MTQEIAEDARSLPVQARADVLVVGAGVSGIAAAVSAARAGAGTILVERSGLLGGVATSGLMASTTNHLFDGAGRQVVKGFAEEFLDRMASAGGISPQYKSPRVPQIPHDPEVFQIVADEMLQQAGAQVILHCAFSTPAMHEQAVAGATVEIASGRAAILSTITVDCTGNADLAARAGAPVRTVKSSGVSLEFRMANVNLDETYGYFKQRPEEYPVLTDIATTFEEFESNWLERGIFHIPHGGGAKMRMVQDKIAAGRFSSRSGTAFGLDHLGMYALQGTDTVIINSNFFEIDPLDVQALTRAEREGRRRCFEVAKFLRENMPGFQRAFIVATAPEIGVRIARCIEGEYVLTAKERDSGARHDDVVGMGSEVIRSVRPPDPFDIPYRILIPRGVTVGAGPCACPQGRASAVGAGPCACPLQMDSLLVAGAKTVSTERPGLIRGQVHGMTLGQAAGVAAALCARNRVAPRSLDVRTLQRALLKQGVYLGDEQRLRTLGLAA
jgi:hypothetical protein